MDSTTGGRAFTGNAMSGRTAKHGTHSGYVTHLKYEGPGSACPECLAAHSEYIQAQRYGRPLPRLTTGRRRHG